MRQIIKTIFKGVFLNDEDCNIKKVEIIEHYETLFELLKGDKEIIETLIQQKNRELELLNCK